MYIILRKTEILRKSCYYDYWAQSYKMLEWMVQSKELLCVLRIAALFLYSISIGVVLFKHWKHVTIKKNILFIIKENFFSVFFPILIICPLLYIYSPLQHLPRSCCYIVKLHVAHCIYSNYSNCDAMGILLNSWCITWWIIQCETCLIVSQLTREFACPVKLG